MARFSARERWRVYPTRDPAIRGDGNGDHNYRGLSRHAFGQYALAINDYNEAIAINPDKARYYSNRGNSYAKVSSEPPALPCLR